MKRLILLVLFLGMASVAVGEVSVRVCLADGNTPFLPIDPNFPHIYPDIMVGTKLTIIVDSNIAEYWSGDLAVADANMDYGLLSGRDYNDTTHDWEGSPFPAAGVEASVCTWQQGGGGDPDIDGFTLYTGFTGREVGDWFIIDYTATNVGTCNVGFYDHSISDEVPIYYLSFSHVRTRDFYNDNIVDFTDFAILASSWRVVDHNDPNWCEEADLDIDDDVDLNDLRLFVEYWLEKTE